MFKGYRGIIYGGLCLIIILIGSYKVTISKPIVLNDVHSQLNQTIVQSLHQPKSEADVINLVKRAIKQNVAISISGTKHAMGGQQFGDNTMHINMLNMNDVIAFDQQTGIITVESGITWGSLIPYIIQQQKGSNIQWGITQKQTGADEITIGGSLAANAHGRGLTLQPIIQDIVSFRMINGNGEALIVSRSENPDLFKLAIGGYGLFGVITSVDIQLSTRQQLQRSVEVVELSALSQLFEDRVNDGYLYGDFQFNINQKSSDFLTVGIFSSYRPVAPLQSMPKPKQRLSKAKWEQLLVLTVSDKQKAYEMYRDYYKSTDGQYYWSDTHQLSVYNPDYMDVIHDALPQYNNHSLMISELYVPLNQLESFMMSVKTLAKDTKMNIAYGTVRLIKQDTESVLAWANQDYACVIFNLMVDHSAAGIATAKQQFQALIDQALKRNGSFFLTYHRWATQSQVLTAYPQFPEFLNQKLKHDPNERFQSNWYRHYKQMLFSN